MLDYAHRCANASLNRNGKDATLINSYVYVCDTHSISSGAVKDVYLTWIMSYRSHPKRSQCFILLRNVLPIHRPKKGGRLAALTWVPNFEHWFDVQDTEGSSSHRASSWQYFRSRVRASPQRRLRKGFRTTACMVLSPTGSAGYSTIAPTGTEATISAP